MKYRQLASLVPKTGTEGPKF